MMNLWRIVPIGLLCLLAACNPSQHLANRYQMHHQGVAVLISPPDYLFKSNVSISYDTARPYTEDQLDSMAWAQSVYVQGLNDTLFLATFTRNLVRTLTSEGYQVFSDSTVDGFLSERDPKWIITLPQAELVESYEWIQKQIFDGENLQYKHYRQNTLKLAFWLEASKANQSKKQVLYLQCSASDKVQYPGTFTMLLTNNFEPYRDSMDLRDAYHFAGQVGTKHANMLHDYFLNDYIAQHLKSGQERQLFHYDFRKEKLVPGLNQRYDVIE